MREPSPQGNRWESTAIDAVLDLFQWGEVPASCMSPDGRVHISEYPNNSCLTLCGEPVAPYKDRLAIKNLKEDTTLAQSVELWALCCKRCQRIFRKRRILTPTMF